MTVDGFEALRDAVRVARDRQIKSVRVLRHALRGMGYNDATIIEALTTWGQYCQKRN